MLVKTKAKFLYYKMIRRNQGDEFEMDDKDIKDYTGAIELSAPPAKRGRPRKENRENS